MKLLFSIKSDWEANIRHGFEGSGHDLTFAELSPPNIARHDVVVPLTLPDLLYLDGLRELLVNNPVPVPCPGVISLCDDKYRFNRKMIDNGFGAYIPRMVKPLPFPYILKKRQDEWGANTHIIGSIIDEQHYAVLLDDPAYFPQAFIPGDKEYTTHILFRGNRIEYAINLQFSFATGSPVKGKDPIQNSCLYPCPFLKLFANILSSIDFEGICCVNYKVIGGRPFIFEINPRFGGSLGIYFCKMIEHVADRNIC